MFEWLNALLGVQVAAGLDLAAGATLILSLIGYLWNSNRLAKSAKEDRARISKQNIEARKRAAEDAHNQEITRRKIEIFTELSKEMTKYMKYYTVAINSNDAENIGTSLIDIHDNLVPHIEENMYMYLAENHLASLNINKLEEKIEKFIYELKAENYQYDMLVDISCNLTDIQKELMLQTRNLYINSDSNEKVIDGYLNKKYPFKNNIEIHKETEPV